MSNLKAKVNGAKNSVFLLLLLLLLLFLLGPWENPIPPRLHTQSLKKKTPWLQTLRFLTEIKQRMTKGLEVLASEHLLYWSQYFHEKIGQFVRMLGWFTSSICLSPLIRLYSLDLILFMRKINFALLVARLQRSVLWFMY